MKIYANYLPQYYPTDFNNRNWGDGFTEWTNVALARPLFRGHVQPQIPGRLGFYDLRLARTQEEQSELALNHGISGFAYWHYWLGNNRLMLEKPAENMLVNNNIKIPFFFAWANHDWKGVFFGAKNECLIKQEYGGLKDIEDHVKYMSKFWEDSRYVKKLGRPFFHVYNPKGIQNCREYLDLYRKEACRLGWPDLWIIGEGVEVYEKHKFGLDAVVYSRHRAIEQGSSSSKFIRGLNLLRNRYFRGLKVYDYEKASKLFLKRQNVEENEYPSIVPNWDTTPRLGKKAVILHGSTPEKFAASCHEVFSAVAKKPLEDRVVYLKSWNEWAEGNYIEPCWRFQDTYLKELREVKKHYE